VLLTRRGLSLVELITALALAALVAAAAVRAVLSANRGYRAHAHRIERRSTLRTAAAVLALELAGISTGDPAGDDLLELAPDAIAYRAVRSVHFLCRPPLPGGDGTVALVVAAEASYGLRAPDPARDSLLAWADSDHRSVADDRWLPGRLVAVTAGGATVVERQEEIARWIVLSELFLLHKVDLHMRFFR